MQERRERSDLIAVDIGNSRIKLGRFQRDGIEKAAISADNPAVDTHRLSEPIATVELPIINTSGVFDQARLAAWCKQERLGSIEWRVASVQRAAAIRFASALADLAKQHAFNWPVQHLTFCDLPLTIRVDEPQRVGIDRLLGALAGNILRTHDRGAIIVDMGTAITVDLLEPDGAFAGGAILPGLAMSAQALAEQTDALPHVDLEFVDGHPAPLGKSTVPAIQSGIYWGTIGAIREMIKQLSAPLRTTPDVFITGGASKYVAETLADQQPTRHLHNLVLSGIALVKP
ncbi:MAG TPA: type III pantothenate kinase [Lacipirellulaceae bacterium]|nr:type III pantothenate kinase [Lacipirellulaceae bacterium]